ncbi:hypothetical protein Hanom_Chr05g00438801 [Helianthus anomalus]
MLFFEFDEFAVRIQLGQGSAGEVTKTMLKNEGIGTGPKVVRAMALNMGMLASYDQSVKFFKDSLGFGEADTILGKIELLYSNLGKLHKIETKFTLHY